MPTPDYPLPIADTGCTVLEAKRCWPTMVHRGGGRCTVAANHMEGSCALSRSSKAPQGGMQCCHCPSDATCGLA